MTLTPDHGRFHAGDIVAVAGERGLFRFRGVATNAAGEQWIEAVEVAGRGRFRSFSMDRKIVKKRAPQVRPSERKK